MRVGGSRWLGSGLEGQVAVCGGEHSGEGAEGWEERKKREWSWQAWGGFATTGAQGLEGVVALGAPWGGGRSRPTPDLTAEEWGCVLIIR